MLRTETFQSQFFNGPFKRSVFFAQSKLQFKQIMIRPFA